MSTILERPLYSIGEASRLLAIESRKLHRWLEGGSVAGRPYPPVIRTEPTGSDSVTWAEFIEAGFLREYRAKQVSLQQLRAVIDQLRTETAVKYPLAFYLPLVLSKELVFKMKFPEQVDFDADGMPLRLRPLGKESRLAIDPDVAFGIPQVGGIRTEVIAEAFAAGDEEQAIAKSWSIGLDDVRAALRWELKKAA